MRYRDYSKLRIGVDHGVATVTIDNPPINLLTMELAAELLRLAEEAVADSSVKVVVFESADPDFFIAHFDVTLLALMSEQRPPPSNDMHLLNRAIEAFRRMPKLSIAKLEGRARGGGSEFVLGLDMRFGAIGKAILSQPEVALGIIPGAGGTQRLARLVGQARALELVLGCDDVGAELAERYGYINRALPAAELSPFVDRLARRIAGFPAEAIALAKKSVQHAQELSVVEGLHEESFLFAHSLQTAEARSRMKKFMALGGQTREAELSLEHMLERLGDSSG